MAEVICVESRLFQGLSTSFPINFDHVRKGFEAINKIWSRFQSSRLEMVREGISFMLHRKMSTIARICYPLRTANKSATLLSVLRVF